jgi:hypothetical protein
VYTNFHIAVLVWVLERLLGWVLAQDWLGWVLVQDWVKVLVMMLGLERVQVL